MKLTPDQLRQNAAAMLAAADGKNVEFKPHGGNTWYDTKGEPLWEFDLKAYRPKPEPVTRPWRAPEDVPGPVCWLRAGGEEYLIVAITQAGPVAFLPSADGKGKQVAPYMWENLSAWSHSTDRKTWFPCTVTQ